MFVGGTSNRKEPVEPSNWAEHSECLTVESSNLPKHSQCPTIQITIVDRLISFLFEIWVFLESEYS